MYLWDCLCVLLFENKRLSLGRNKEYLHYVVHHATNVTKAATILHFLPEFLKPSVPSYLADSSIINLFFRDLRRGQKVAHKHLAPIIEERRRLEGTKGYEKPVLPPFTFLISGGLSSMAYGFRSGN